MQWANSLATAVKETTSAIAGVTFISPVALDVF